MGRWLVFFIDGMGSCPFNQIDGTTLLVLPHTVSNHLPVSTGNKLVGIMFSTLYSKLMIMLVSGFSQIHHLACTNT